jgi:hypothetical protein
MLFMPSFGDADFGVFFVMWFLMMLFLIVGLAFSDATFRRAAFYFIFRCCCFSLRLMMWLLMLPLLIMAFDHGF